MDAPDILPLEFLFAVMNDPNVDLKHRMDAVVKLMELGMGQYSCMPEVRIQITRAAPVPQPDIMHRRVYKTVGHDLFEWDVKGHA
jgi:hypothetical protein